MQRDPDAPLVFVEDPFGARIDPDLEPVVLSHQVGDVECLGGDTSEIVPHAPDDGLPLLPVGFRQGQFQMPQGTLVTAVERSEPAPEKTHSGRGHVHRNKPEQEDRRPENGGLDPVPEV